MLRMAESKIYLVHSSIHVVLHYNEHLLCFCVSLMSLVSSTINAKHWELFVSSFVAVDLM